MIDSILKKFGYISQKRADAITAQRIEELLSKIEGYKPGDELLDAASIGRKFGFKIVYALSDGNAEENAFRLFESMMADKNHNLRRFLPNVKVVDDKSLLS